MGVGGLLMPFLRSWDWVVWSLSYQKPRLNSPFTSDQILCPSILQKIAVVACRNTQSTSFSGLACGHLCGLTFALLNLSKASFAVSIYCILLRGNTVSILPIKSQEIDLDMTITPISLILCRLLHFGYCFRLWGDSLPGSSFHILGSFEHISFFV